MKNIVFTLVLAMISSIATAQTDLSQLKQNDKNEYLDSKYQQKLRPSGRPRRFVVFCRPGALHRHPRQDNI